MALDVVNMEDSGSQYRMVKVTPPQTVDNDITVGKGAYCFVIDVSGRWEISRAHAAWGKTCAATSVHSRARIVRPIVQYERRRANHHR